MKPMFMCVLAIVTASVLSSCAGFTGKASPWMMEKLVKHAAFDMQCTEDQLQTQETGTWTYGVRGCSKQAVYKMHACNQMTRQCTFERNGEISETESSAETTPTNEKEDGNPVSEEESEPTPEDTESQSE
ncbi:MAG: hypothetical protein GY854_26300 [Deltaproteobacteria bacterium]|nr:hypothetical protein [Deltaproteobacteria bacterium]